MATFRNLVEANKYAETHVRELERTTKQEFTDEELEDDDCQHFCGYQNTVSDPTDNGPIELKIFWRNRTTVFVMKHTLYEAEEAETLLPAWGVAE